MRASGPNRVLRCCASGRGGAWEAICLDLDIAVQGRSFDDVAKQLNEAIALYLETVADLPEDERSALLNRSVPLWTRIRYAVDAFLMALRTSHHGELKHRYTVAAPAHA